ncbi:MAG: alpha-amylase family protein [Bacteroidia bacterium]
MYQPTLHQLIEQTLASLSAKLKGKAAVSFAGRLGANLEQIHKDFRSLYGEREGFEKHFEALVQTLAQAFANRSASLRNRDSMRENNPEWLTSQDITGMALYVDRFAKTIGGVEEKLDYFEELGVNWLHLMPLLDCPEGSNDGGYAVRNYRKVDERLGSMADLKSLAEKLHDRNMLLTLDLVLNHTSDEHEWAVKARNGEEKYQRYFYMYPDRRVPDILDETMTEVFPESSPGNFTWVPEIDRWVMTVFHHYQWDLNYRNPDVFIEMLDIILFMANLGVDILRVDAPAFIWKRIGTEGRNLWEAHLLLQLFKACTQVVAPSMAFIAEAIVAPREIIRYFGEGIRAGRECEIAYNATLMALLWDAFATRDTRLLLRAMNRIPGKPLGTTWITYVRCHDDIGLGFDDEDIYAVGYDAPTHRQFLLNYFSGKYEGSKSKGAIFSHNPRTGDGRISGSLAALAGLEQAIRSGNQEDQSLAVRAILMLHGIVLAYGGLPMLFYGDELGMCNDYSYVHETDKAYDNRWMHRPVMDWEVAKLRHTQGSTQQQIFSGLQRLISVRKDSPEFADQNNTSFEESGNQHVLAFLRWDQEGRKTLVLANFSDHPQQLSKQTIHRLGINPDLAQDRVLEKPLVMEGDSVLLDPFSCLYVSEK